MIEGRGYSVEIREDAPGTVPTTGEPVGGDLYKISSIGTGKYLITTISGEAKTRPLLPIISMAIRSGCNFEPASCPVFAVTDLAGHCKAQTDGQDAGFGLAFCGKLPRHAATVERAVQNSQK